MSSSPSVPIDGPRLAYGALFAVALPVLLGWWARSLDRRLELPGVGSTVTGYALATLGALMIVAAVLELRIKGGGWPMSPYPPQRLVTSGIYAFVAHPLYLGSVHMVFGLAMALASPAGVWIVTPVLAAACIAFVWGSEGERTEKLFGVRSSRALLRLPDASDAPPALSDRVSVCFLAILPWFVVYEAINRLPTPADAIAVASSWDARIPVIGWTELIYFLAYPIALIAPFVAVSRRDLRALTIRAWAATIGAAVIYLAIPTTFEKKPVPETRFAPLLEFERTFDAPNTHFPAFHVIWVMLTMDLYARAFPRWRALRWPVVLAVAVSCVTTGMHAIVDVIAGLVLGLVFLRIESLWRFVARRAEAISASRAEWRLGPVRLLNHGVYAAIAAALGLVLATMLAGESYRREVALVAVAVIAGAALWAQWVEGSATLQRPYGYFGGVVAAVAVIAVTSLWTGTGLLLLAAYTVIAPFVQAVGRLRCLVQGCCHGRPTTAIGIRVTHPASRVVCIAGLSGVPLHATAVYSMLVNLVISVLLLRMWIAGAPLAFIAGAHFILSGLGRFVEEHFRGEPQTRVVAGLRLYQWISIASVVAGAVLTTIPSPPAPPVSGVSLATLLAALAIGLVAYVAYGVDFPKSTRRFARLS